MNTGFYSLLRNKKLAFVWYSLPGSTQLVRWISYQPRQFSSIQNLPDEDTDAFVFAPFESNSNAKVWLLQADENLSGETDFVALTTKLKTLPAVARKETQTESTSKPVYEKAFEKLMKSLNEGKADKVILSRQLVQQTTAVDFFALFEKLTEAYPNAFCYFIKLPTGEMWMGATPEVLVKQDKQGLKTMALAGTQVLGNRTVSVVEWGDKEREEQDYVRQYVQDVLSAEFGQDSIAQSETYSVQAAQLVHLRTDFQLNNTVERKALSRLVDHLHPTPAICGIPLEASKRIIAETEQHARRYYAGFLGPIRGNNVALFVNLRCMQLFANAVVLYVGGGITRNSNMQSEWAETQAKAQTLLSVLL